MPFGIEPQHRRYSLLFVTIVKKRREELKEALGTNALGSCAKASYDSQKKVVESDWWRGALGNKRLGFLREGLSDGRLAARVYDDTHRALSLL